MFGWKNKIGKILGKSWARIKILFYLKGPKNELILVIRFVLSLSFGWTPRYAPRNARLTTDQTNKSRTKNSDRSEFSVRSGRPCSLSLHFQMWSKIVPWVSVSSFSNWHVRCDLCHDFCMSNGLIQANMMKV